jgi:hypothetical protein
MNNEEMVQARTWEQFRETGLHILVNSILHIFGWSIAFKFKIDKETRDKDKNYEGELVEVYPARTKFRGFPSTSTDRMYKNISKWMRETSIELEKEANTETISEHIAIEKKEGE